MPVSGRAVISYTYTVGRCHPEHKRARDGAVSDLLRAFSWEGFYRRKFCLPSRLFSDRSSKPYKTYIGGVRCDAGMVSEDTSDRVTVGSSDMGGLRLFGITLFRKMGIPGLIGILVS